MPLQNKFNAFDSSFLLRLGFILAIKNASKFYLVLAFLGAYSNSRPTFKSIGGSDFLMLLCTAQHTSTFSDVSPTQVSPHAHSPLCILQDGCKFLS